VYHMKLGHLESKLVGQEHEQEPSMHATCCMLQKQEILDDFGGAIVSLEFPDTPASHAGQETSLGGLDAD
jgi:hypothetical protein